MWAITFEVISANVDALLTTQESGQGIRDRAKRIEEIEAALRAIAGAGAFGS